MLSVVIPAYNAESHIEECLKSVIDQTKKDIAIEIVIVNDGSDDNTHDLILSFMEQYPTVDFNYIIKPNGGVSSARNMGIARSKYDWIAFLDSDDVWLPQKIEKQLDFINNFSANVDFLGCARNNEILSILGMKITSPHKASVRELLVKMYPQTSTALVKKSLLEKVGGYDESMSHAEDGELWIRICAAGDFYYIPDSLVITGRGKPNFGVQGLSANIDAMEKGVNITLNRAYKNNQICFLEYLVGVVFYKMKYIRRVLIARGFNRAV